MEQRSQFWCSITFNEVLLNVGKGDSESIGLTSLNLCCANQTSRFPQTQQKDYRYLQRTISPTYLRLLFQDKMSHSLWYLFLYLLTTDEAYMTRRRAYIQITLKESPSWYQFCIIPEDHAKEQQESHGTTPKLSSLKIQSLIITEGYLRTSLLKCNVDDVQTGGKNRDMWSLLLAQSTRMDDIRTVPFSGVKTEEGKSSNRHAYQNEKMSCQTWHVPLLTANQSVLDNVVSSKVTNITKGEKHPGTLNQLIQKGQIIEGELQAEEHMQ